MTCPQPLVEITFRIAPVRFQAIILLVLLILAVAPTATLAKTPLTKTANEPTVVQVGVKLDQIVSIDQTAENFAAVYTYRLRYRDPALAFNRAPDDPPFRMMTIDRFLAEIQEKGLIWPDTVLANKQGRRDKTLENVKIFPDGDIHVYERSTATFQAPDFDFRDFPFDDQHFYIRVVSLMPQSVYVFEPLSNGTGIGDQLGEEEWVVFDHSSGIDTITDLDGYQYSRLSLDFQGRRHLVYYIVRIFVPIMIILAVSWITFRLKDYLKRVDLGVTVLLLLIAFNFTLGSDLPRLGYLTAVDAFIAGTFVITGAVILVNVQLRLWERQGRDVDAERLDRIAMIGYWPAYLLGMSTALLII